MSKKEEKQAISSIKTAQGVSAGRAAETFAPAAAGYGEFAKTGGVSPEEENLARRQTSYGISNLYAALKQNLARRGRVQGGYSPGMGANQAQLGRQGAEQVAQGLTGTNLNLLEMKRQGKLAGIGGLGGLYGTSAGMQTSQLGQQAELANAMKGPWSNFLQGVSTLGGAAASLYGGGVLSGLAKKSAPMTGYAG